jgi:hypothetical protein
VQAAQPSVLSDRFFPERSKKAVNKSNRRSRMSPAGMNFPLERLRRTGKWNFAVPRGT